MDPSLSASSSRAPPFSLVEFGDLVSAALESPDPLLSFTSSQALFSLPYGSGKPRPEDDESGSRVRQMLRKFKKRAVSLVKRPSTRPPDRTRATSPEFRIPELRLSVHNVSCDEFVPYLPLAAQYERMSPYEHPISAFSSTPSLPTARSLYTSSNSSHYSFAPSPSTSSCSSGSTSSDSQYPTTPLTTVSEENCAPRRWSASSSAETDALPSSYTDPFAKPALRVVARAPAFPTTGRPLRRRGRLPLSPAKPPPACPIPAPPLPRYAHPYCRAQPVSVPASPATPSPTPNSHSKSKSNSRAPSLLDAFPTPPSHTPTPPNTPPATPKRRYRASSPFPFTPPHARGAGAGADWLFLDSSPDSVSASSCVPSPRSGRSGSGSAASTSGHSDDVFHSACEGAF
ncbi:hypothetical protein B0H11DRAFT_1939458 [Mycena galericulata]|nr:hypothetical protein B0H11DRAFT_1939458 [Mycena galericulata]